MARRTPETDCIEAIQRSTEILRLTIEKKARSMGASPDPVIQSLAARWLPQVQRLEAETQRALDHARSHPTLKAPQSPPQPPQVPA